MVSNVLRASSLMSSICPTSACSGFIESIIFSKRVEEELALQISL